ncbi:MAG: DUF948 domain-containing protein [Leptolyngbyaceae cyanobacterium]
MTDPLFWLVLSLLFVTVSLTMVLVVAVPALKEVARAARSAEKLFDTLQREFPPTLQSIRLTGMEISDLTGDVSQGVQSAGSVVKQVDTSITQVRQQAKRVHSRTRSVFVGVKAAWKTLTSPQKSSQRSPRRLSSYTAEPEYQTPYAVNTEYRATFTESYESVQADAYSDSDGDKIVANSPTRGHEQSDELHYVQLTKDGQADRSRSVSDRPTDDGLLDQIT